MPEVGVKLARGEYIQLAAFRYGDVGDDKAVVVLGHVLVDGIGQESKVAIEEEDDDEGEEGGGGELGDGAHLSGESGVSDECPHALTAYTLHATRYTR